MVDKNFLSDMKSGKGKKDKKKKKKKSGSDSSSGSGSSSSGGGADEPFHLDDDARMSPDDVEVASGAEQLAEGAELNTGANGMSLSKYRKRQVKECEELYDDVRDNVKQYGGDLMEFTAVLQAILMNLAQNKHGIAMTLQDEYGMNRSKAQKEARKITKRAGEPEVLDWVAFKLAKDLAK